MLIGAEPILAEDGHRAGRELLRRLYEAYTGRPLPAILVTERGKPYFERDPLYFSISHTPSHVFCALSERPVGIDAEEMDREIDLRLAEKVLSSSEYARYEMCPDKRQALLKLWVMKEAQAKLTGQGLRGYPNDTDFSPDDPRVTVRENCFLAILEE